MCGVPAERCDAAHLWDRSLGGTGFDEPDLVIPLCSLIKAGNGCHDLYDAHELDILARLTIEEQVAMVKAAGSIARAYRRAIGQRTTTPGESLPPWAR
jgi:hypothetical protein